MSAHSSSHTHWPAALAMLAITAAWGLSFPLVQWGAGDIGVYPFLTLRFCIASALIGLIAWRQVRSAPRSTTARGIQLGVICFAAFASQTEGLRFTTSGNSALITSMYLLGIPLWKWGRRREPIARVVWISTVMAIAGMYLLTNYSWHGWNRGDALTVITAIVTAAHMIITERATRRHALLPLVFWQIVTVAAISGVICLATSQWPAHVTTGTWATLWTMAVLCTVLALLVQTWAQRHLPAERIGLICALEGLFGLLAGMFLGNERLTVVSTIGATFMICATIATETRMAMRQSTR